MKDYHVTVTVRNNFLMVAMQQAGIPTAAALYRASGVDQSTIGRYLALREIPISPRTGKWKPNAEQLAKVLGVAVWDLFPPQHHEKPLPVNKATHTASVEEVLHYIEDTSVDQMALPDAVYAQGEQSDKIDQVLWKALDHRYRNVIERRYGLAGYKAQTFEHIANKLGLTRERVRQMEARAMRKLRHPSNSKQLREYYV